MAALDVCDRVLRIGRRDSPLEAELRVPGDKSISHRAVLFSSLASGPVQVEGLLESADVRATINAVRRLGISVRKRATTIWTIGGRGVDGHREPDCPLDCLNSGTTARVLTGLLAASPFFSVLTGDTSLRSRPMGRVVRPLTLAGATILGRDGGRLLPLAIHGKSLEPFEYRIPEASAQVKTALLLAAMKTRGTSRIIQDASTRDHTERLLRYLGVELRSEGTSLIVGGPAQPAARDLAVPGDPSSAAFFAVAGLLVPGSCVKISGVCLNPTRLGFVQVLRRMGARLGLTVTGQMAGEEVGDLVARGSELTATTVEAGEVPSLVDEVPILAVAASRARGETWFRGVGELRAKESDRLAALRRELGALGAELEEVGDDLCVRGPRELTGAPVDSEGDHRIAMALSVAALTARGVTELGGHACVRISFPDFCEKFREMLGETQPH
ncbi:MAG: 3-phosphoshikimate 1-carboxyvinyltransferase [Candidatus Riflebacteria bacterium]|nr:3-phosphoshikimate 1-carboxyvinyltransferase [Candidatus Riflebacteria bacterium]